SGSFEYPNTAAAYLAMSLPIVWFSSLRPTLRAIFVLLLWSALALTYSKGGLLALPIIAIIARPTGVFRLLAAGAAAYAILLPMNPLLLERLYGPGMGKPTAAEYEAPWNKLRQKPHVLDGIPIRIRNTGITTWRYAGSRRIAVAYRWWNKETEKFDNATPVI